MQANQYLLKTPINFQVLIAKNLEKDLLVPKINPSIPAVNNEGKAPQPAKKKPYAEPIISRSPQKDRIEIW